MVIFCCNFFVSSESLMSFSCSSLRDVKSNRRLQLFQCWIVANAHQLLYKVQLPEYLTSDMAMNCASSQASNTHLALCMSSFDFGLQVVWVVALSVLVTCVWVAIHFNWDWYPCMSIVHNSSRLDMLVVFVAVSTEIDLEYRLAMVW